ncbi:hypothetical protein cyc_05242 [Cyclospora cayetanensis]|uniref:Uncharacterized protein n=1 Tax=Cyclospora cayetanensis TaxID=88456 RepID=A0A1D3CR57_9EIME|nr:hypothetical protein cyc_05242 [Cyclospora cayetanensis]
MGRLLRFGAFSALLLGEAPRSGLCINMKPSSSFSSHSNGSKSPALTPLEEKPFSQLEAGAMEAPALNLEENDDCIFTGVVPENQAYVRKTVELSPTQWAEHVHNEVYVNNSLKAYQTTTDPGREREFGLTFKLPSTLASSGSANLSLTKIWDGFSHGWTCESHMLTVIRLTDDKYLHGRNSSSESNDYLYLPIGFDLEEYKLDISSLVYGKNLKGSYLHLLFREKENGCLSEFDTPKSNFGPKLSVETEESDATDAVYGEWGPFSDCRVSCVTKVNYQCRKRTCTPGVSSGVSCKMERMVDKQPCSDSQVSSPCTCDKLIEENACPENSSCNSSVANNVMCNCSGKFTRLDVSTKTVCEGTAAAGSDSTTTSAEESSSTNVIWIILGIAGVVVVVGSFALLCVKKKPLSDADLLNANLNPQTGELAPGTAELGAGMFWPQQPGMLRGPPAMGAPHGFPPIGGPPMGGPPKGGPPMGGPPKGGGVPGVQRPM